MDASIAYEYTPLPPRHIRLVYFTGLSKSKTDPASITYSLKTISFDNTTSGQDSHDGLVQYHALSYTWGSQSDTYPLICDGKVMQIHRNLYEALPYLASRNSALPLWIDAISINQADDKEKIEQIRLMTDIYRRAISVWAWLGVAQEPGGREAVENILPRVEAACKTFDELPLGTRLQPRELDLPALTSPAWPAYLYLINNPWFFRLWVVQEAALAQQLIFLYGHHQIELDVLRSAIRCSGRLSHLHDEHGRTSPFWPQFYSKASLLFRCRETYQNWASDGTRDAAVGLLSGIFVYTSSHHHCQDPRDRVLALLGFMPSEYAKNILIDEMTSAADLYVQFIQFLLSGNNPGSDVLDLVFSLAVFLRQEDQALPSWCPDLHRCYGATERQLNIIAGRRFRASERVRSHRNGRSPLGLCMRGSVVDTVEAVCEAYHPPDHGDLSSWLAYAAHFQQWEQQASELAKPLFKHQTSEIDLHHDSGFSELDYWLTLIAEDEEKLRVKVGLTDFLDARSSLEAILGFVVRGGIQRVQYNLTAGDPAMQPEPFTSEEQREFLTHMQRFRVDGDSTPADNAITMITMTQEGCRVFRTTDGRLGFARGTFAAGDQLVVFDGASVVHIIRKRKEKRSFSRLIGKSEEEFELVGVAYLRGMMHGGVERLGIDSQDILLI